MEGISQSAGCFEVTAELAYLIGVYLGDGSVWFNKHRNQYVFSLEVIDLDFAVKTKQAVEKVTGRSLTIRTRRRACVKGGETHRIRTSHKQLCDFLTSCTDKKTKIPGFIPMGKNPLAKALIEGLMDSEGCIYRYTKIQPRYKSPTYKIQVGMSSPVVDGLSQYLRSYGVATYARRVRIPKSGTPHTEYTLSSLDYIDSGLQFNIARKQQRVEDYRSQLKTSSETEIFTRNRKDTVSPDTLG